MSLRRTVAAALLLALLLTGCGGAPKTVRIEVSPGSTRADEPVALRVTGLPPGQPVELDLRSVDARGSAWDAGATFTADDAGAVDPASAAPTAGSYLGVDAMGLFSALHPLEPDPDPRLAYRWPDVGPAAFDLTAARSGKVLATARVERTFWTAAPSITSLTLEHDGFIGTYYRPAGAPKGPAVLTLGGSEGGDLQIIAAILASRGIPALSVAYFGAPGLPAHLSRIPLEYFDTPLRWLRSRPEVDPGRVWIAGGSRGSEAAALVASDRPDLVHGLLDLSPSSAAGCAYDPAAQDPCPGPAWTRDGKAVAHTLQLNGADAAAVRRATIPVEKIDGPVLTLCGGADLVWDSCRFSDAIQARLRAHGFRHPTLALAYPDAGHFIDLPIPYFPVPPDTPGALPTYGSTPLANDEARAQAWPRLLAFVTG